MTQIASMSECPAFAWDDWGRIRGALYRGEISNSTWELMFKAQHGYPTAVEVERARKVLADLETEWTKAGWRKP